MDETHGGKDATAQRVLRALRLLFIVVGGGGGEVLLDAAHHPREQHHVGVYVRSDERELFEHLGGHEPTLGIGGRRAGFIPPPGEGSRAPRRRGVGVRLGDGVSQRGAQLRVDLAVLPPRAVRPSIHTATISRAFFPSFITCVKKKEKEKNACFTPHSVEPFFSFKLSEYVCLSCLQMDTTLASAGSKPRAESRSITVAAPSRSFTARNPRNNPSFWFPGSSKGVDATTDGQRRLIHTARHY